jgi:hypothetical protein
MEYKNFAYSRIATAPSPATTGTSLVVDAGDGALFPSTFPFNAVIWPVGELPLSTNAEIVKVTNVSTNTFTIERQKEGTSARTVIIGDRISATITAYTARTFRFLNPVVKTTTYTVDDNDDLVICNSATPFTVTLLAATGSGRVVNIKNINSGLVTIEGNLSETIDSELNQSLNAFSNIQVCDYASGKWIII